MRDGVPNEPLRRLFMESGLSASEVARRAGWLGRCNDRTKPDSTRVLRSLGLRPGHGRKGSTAYQSNLSEEGARSLCEALGADFDVLYRGHDEDAGTCPCGERLVERVEDGLCGWCREEIVLS